MGMAGNKRKDAGSKSLYEIARDVKIARNNEYLKKLNLQNVMLIPIPGASSSQSQKNDKNIYTSLANHDEDPEYEGVDEDMDDGTDDGTDDDDLDGETDDQAGEHYEPVEETHVPQPKERRVRGPTKMKSITRTKGKIKMYVKINRYGQPCGLKTCNFTNFIATLVKGGDLSLREKDWRKVEDKKKIWTLVNKYFTIDPICEEWVMASAGKKWRDFKSTLKKKYFDVNLNEQENIAKGCKNRIPTPDWEWLVNYWCKEETKARSEQNKQVRANQVSALHTCGSRSYVVVSNKLEKEMGREPTRAELYIVTHTNADGRSINEECQNKIDLIRERIENDHNLALKTIDDGDLYADIFPKEQKGRIRGLGLLPSGSKSVALARNTAAMRHMQEENAQLKARIENQEDKYNELKNMILSMQGVGSPGVGSIDARNGSPRVGPVDACNGSPEVESIGARSVDRSAGVGAGACSVGVGNGLGSTSRGAASLCADKGGLQYVSAVNVVDQSLHDPVHIDKRAAVATKHTSKTTIHHNRQEMAEPMGQKLQSLSSSNKVHVDELKQTRVRNLGQKQRTSGLDVALRSPSSSNIVAYGRLGRTDKDAKAADGLPLGGFYEVFVDVVVDRQFSLPRAQGQATKMGSALGRCIAWPFQNVVQKDGSPLNISKCAIGNIKWILC